LTFPPCRLRVGAYAPGFAVAASPVINAPARPAGGIHGTVIRADGSPATSAFVTVFAGKLPTGEKDHRHLNPSSARGSSTFLLTVPLGGRYRVLARESSDTDYVWAVSEEVAIDENHPIAKVPLVLLRGKPLRIKVLDPEGRPIANQPIKLEIAFSQPEPAYSFSSLLKRRTGVEIHLWRGLSAVGVLVDAASGKPIPNAVVRIFPRDFTRAQFKANIETKTNDRGAFHFEGLEDMAYSAHVESAVPKGTIVTRNGNGTSFSYPAGVERPSLRAGDQKVRWEMKIYPGSSLRGGD
jgi:hypothetical protein